MDIAQLNDSAHVSYYLGWDKLSDQQKMSRFGIIAQEAASRGDWVSAAAAVLCAQEGVKA